MAKTVQIQTSSPGKSPAITPSPIITQRIKEESALIQQLKFVMTKMSQQLQLSQRIRSQGSSGLTHGVSIQIVSKTNFIIIKFAVNFA